MHDDFAFFGMLEVNKFQRSEERMNKISEEWIKFLPPTFEERSCELLDSDSHQCRRSCNCNSVQFCVSTHFKQPTFTSRIPIFITSNIPREEKSFNISDEKIIAIYQRAELHVCSFLIEFFVLIEAQRFLPPLILMHLFGIRQPESKHQNK